jgi:predicted transcriptional regulator
MTPKVITFCEDSEVRDIARVMIEQKINRVPVVRDCRVVGIVSRSDIVKAIATAARGTAPKSRKKQETIELT